jgi:hypothetical protein
MYTLPSGNGRHPTGESARASRARRVPVREAPAVNADLRYLADAATAHHGLRVEILTAPHCHVPYLITVSDPRTTKTVNFRPASIAFACCMLSAMLDGLYLAKGDRP